YVAMGHVLLYRSRKERRASERMRMLRDALVAMDAAFARCQGKDPDKWLPTVLLNRSAVALELGNAETGDRRRVLLLAAQKDADQATKIQKRYPEYAWQALGNAHEDLAYL